MSLLHFCLFVMMATQTSVGSSDGHLVLQVGSMIGGSKQRLQTSAPNAKAYYNITSECYDHFYAIRVCVYS